MQLYPATIKKQLLKSRADLVAGTVKCAVLGTLPNREAESDLVDEVSQVVDQVEAAVIHTTHEVAKEVASRVDRPACSDDRRIVPKEETTYLFAEPRSPATLP